MIGDAARLKILDANRCVIALSGGLDSVVLLDLVVAIQPRALVALHIDHQLFPGSSKVADFCRELCQGYGIEIHVVQVDVTGDGSIEARAREARYEAFEQFLKPGDLLLQAHHRDDQIETVLLSLFRGSRAPGLRGMPDRRALGAAELARPLLDLSRSEIQQYALEQTLVWREDPTNEDLSIDRNYVRHRILPVIGEHFPHAGAAILRGLARDTAFDKRLHEADFQALLTVRIEPDCLKLAGLRQRPKEAIAALLDCWLTTLDIPRISGRCLEEMAARIVAGAEVDMRAGDVLFRQHDAALFVLKVLPEPDVNSFSLGAGSLQLSGGVLANEAVEGKGLPRGRDYAVTFRRGGEHIRIGRNRSLKNLFQENQVPVWLRDRVPLIYAPAESGQRQLVAVAGLGDWGVPMVVADDWQTTPGSAGMNLVAVFEDRVFKAN